MGILKSLQPSQITVSSDRSVFTKLLQGSCCSELPSFDVSSGRTKLMGAKCGLQPLTLTLTLDSARPMEFTGFHGCLICPLESFIMLDKYIYIPHRGLVKRIK